MEYLLGVRHHHWLASLLTGACIGPSSITTETSAIMWALRWVASVGFNDMVNLNVDNLESAKMAEGLLVALTPLDHEMQALWAVRRHQLLSWDHVKAHSGHTWNELADSLAKLAADDFDDPVVSFDSIKADRYSAWDWLTVASDNEKAAYPCWQEGSWVALRPPVVCTVSDFEEVTGLHHTSQRPAARAAVSTLFMVSHNVQTLHENSNNDAFRERARP